MQKGYIYQTNGAWHVRYRVDGKQVSRKLADYNDQYRTKRSVRPLADEVLDPLNQGLQVNGPMTLQQYAETVYFPNIKTKKSPSTVKGYLRASWGNTQDACLKRLTAANLVKNATSSAESLTLGHLEQILPPGSQ